MCIYVIFPHRMFIMYTSHYVSKIALKLFSVVLKVKTWTWKSSPVTLDHNSAYNVC